MVSYKRRVMQEFADFVERANQAVDQDVITMEEYELLYSYVTEFTWDDFINGRNVNREKIVKIAKKFWKGSAT